VRGTRVRYDPKMAYYHLRNQVAGEPDYFPFGPAEKEKLFSLALELPRFYSIKLLSVVVLGNHYHMLCAVPATPPTRTQVMRNWHATHGEGKQEPDWDDPQVVDALAERMGSVSSFIADLQQRFTSWFNRTRPEGRRGRIWAGRCKDLILERDTSLWPCLAYVETNPMRAGLAELPGDYPFSTWGRMTDKGTHPFATNLARHLRPSLGRVAKDWPTKRVIAELTAQMTQRVTTRPDDSVLAEEEAMLHSRSRFPITLRHRIRHWTDGVVIGSEPFVRGVGAQFQDAKHAQHKRLPRGISPDSPDTPPLFAYRQLGPAQ